MDCVEKFIVRHKSAFQKVVAFLCAVGILGGCVLVSFCFPVPASAAGEAVYDMYLDSLPGRITNGPMSPADGVQIGMQLGLRELYETMIETGQNWNAGDLSTMCGYYYHGNELHFAWNGIKAGIVNNSDGGYTLFYSDEGEVRTTITGANMRAYTVGLESYSGNNYRVVFTSESTRYNDLSVNITDVLSPGLFQSAADYTVNTGSYSGYYGVGCFWGSGAVPIIPSDANITTYFNSVSYLGNATPITGWNDTSVSPVINIGDIPGASDFVFTSDNYLDFILEIYNPYIEEEYPDLTVYLWYPSEDPTEDTTECPECGGCNCIHNITVNVEPTVNVYVENQLPSEWLEDFTLPSGDVVETLPEPTMPTVNETQEMTLPAMEIDSSLADGMHFWAELWTSLVFASDILPIVTLILLLTIAEWVLWHVGR